MEQPEKKPTVVQGELFPLETVETPVPTEDTKEPVQPEPIRPKSILSTLSDEELEFYDTKDPDDFKKGQL
jgi:hypothetical protein